MDGLGMGTDFVAVSIKENIKNIINILQNVNNRVLLIFGNSENNTSSLTRAFCITHYDSCLVPFKLYLYIKIMNEIALLIILNVVEKSTQ